MIYLQLTDGLGNQMFQYAFARCLQLQTGDMLQINTHAFTFDPQREYALAPFCLSESETYLLLGNEEGRRQYRKTDFWNHVIYRLGLSRGTASFEKLAKRGLYFTFEIYSYMGIPSCRKKKKYIAGNFQSPLYFEAFREQICADFQLRDEVREKLSPALVSLREEMLLQENSVCVHVRRGDYVTNEKDDRILNICGAEYYRKAVEYCKKQLGDPIFYVFSNDHADVCWVREHYDFFPENTVFVDMENGDFEELYLMTGCKHYIIANSTYSFWAQYLGQREDTKGIVVAPSLWTRQDYDTKDIYMENWHLVEVQ